MKSYNYLLLLLFILKISPLKSQDHKNEPYNVWVKVIGQETQQKAYLLELRDTSILVQTVRNAKNKFPAQIVYTLNQIEAVSFRNQNGFLKGAALGGVVGVGTGTLIGINQEDSESYWWGTVTKEEKTLTWASIMGIIGGVLGGILGDAKKRYTLNGTQSIYDRYRPSWEKYIYPKHKLPPLPK